jgi:uncharacterized membrane protein
MFSNLIWLLLLALLLGLLLGMLLGRLRGRQRPWGPPPPYAPFKQPHPLSALQILQQRYAHGEIDGATFDKMRERLEASERPD